MVAAVAVIAAAVATVVAAVIAVAVATAVAAAIVVVAATVVAAAIVVVAATVVAVIVAAIKREYYSAPVVPNGINWSGMVTLNYSILSVIEV